VIIILEVLETVTMETGRENLRGCDAV